MLLIEINAIKVHEFRIGCKYIGSTEEARATIKVLQKWTNSQEKSSRIVKVIKSTDIPLKINCPSHSMPFTFSKRQLIILITIIILKILLI